MNTSLPRVDVSRQNGVVTLTMHGHKSVNLINSTMMDALLKAGEGLRSDPDVRLIVLTGADGKGFIGGADIAEMQHFTPETARSFITQMHADCHQLRALPIPSIARVDGPCLGAGLELAAACDLRIGSTTSSYGMPEVQVGLPSVIEATLLPSLIGWGHTRELLYRGHVMDAAEALRIGYLQKLAPRGEMNTAMQRWIDDILRADPAAIRTQKRLIEGWLDTDIPTSIQASIDAFGQTFTTDAPNKRLRAFFEEKKK
jgi:enoyl-CoA hydratase/carnithine racemase